MAPPTARGRRQRGFTYLTLLIVIAAIGAGLAATGSIWREVQRRNNERELLFVGMQIRRAIQSYFDNPTAMGRYPPSFEALLLDARTPAIKRYLRRPYRDPLTNSREWGIVIAPQGGIMGVYSLAPGTPIKRANFPRELNWGENMGSYADWRFIYEPSAMKP